MPERGANMGDGWETKRRRAIGDVTVDRDNDWYILQLAAKGSIQKILVDTCHFKGNYPDAFAIEGAVLTDAQAADIEMLKADAHADALTRSNRTEPTDSSADIDWQPIIGRTKLYEDREHTFKEELVSGATAFTHVRIKMYPDGGISRLRLWGFPQVD